MGEYEEDDYERIRQENLRQRDQLLSSIFDDTKLSDALNELKDAVFAPGADSLDKPIRKRKRESRDGAIHFNVQIPLEKRQSARLANRPVEFTYADLPDEENKSNKKYFKDATVNDFEDLVRPFFKRRRDLQVVRRSSLAPVVPVEEITEEYLSKIAVSSTGKVYSPDSGTSCHQCRQKTLDSKTYCRSGRCIGVQGQFCGPCLKNRYGEEATVALLDPKWCCPLCRGICNCSICRNKKGMRPTGILAPIALDHGHISVHHFLESLNGKGDFPEEDERYLSNNNDNNMKSRLESLMMESRKPVLLGFKDGSMAIFAYPQTWNLCGQDDSDIFLLGFDETEKAKFIPKEEFLIYERCEIQANIKALGHAGNCLEQLEKIVENLSRQLLESTGIL